MPDLGRSWYMDLNAASRVARRISGQPSVTRVRRHTCGVGVLLSALALVGGLHGVVLRGPTSPVCRVGVSCNAPAVGAVLVFSRGGQRAVRVRVRAGGHYSVRLRAGSYTVRVSPVPRIGFGVRPSHVHVAAEVNARVDFSIDTGIR
jgi:hypothetical protein